MLRMFILCVAITWSWTYYETATPEAYELYAVSTELSDVNYSYPTEFELFADSIAKLESGFDHTVVNQYGMLGKYQFSPVTLMHLGFDVTEKEFLSRPHLQDSVFLVYYRRNQRELQDIITTYVGATHKGFEITLASIMAGAHFAGPTGLRNYLTASHDSTGVVDGNGTSLKYYMEKFSGFELELEL